MKEREIALHCLADITDGGQFANRVLEQQLKNRDERTQGFVRHVVYGVLDRKRNSIRPSTAPTGPAENDWIP